MSNKITKMDPSVMRVESFIKEKTVLYECYDYDLAKITSYEPKQAIKSIIIFAEKHNQEKKL